MMAIGEAGGKIILLGEHFVVYGIPAIAAALSNKAVVEVKKSKKTEFIPKVDGTIPELTSRAISNIFSVMNIKDNFKIILTGNLPTYGGLGSSAAFCVALVRALANEYNLKLSNEQVNSYAYEGEKAFHGNPSGIDNTVSTYGGVIKFIRGKCFEQIKIASPLYFTIGFTGISSPTAEMVERIRKFKEAHCEKFQLLCKEVEDIIIRAEDALASGDVKLLGELMNENHYLLREIGVSTEKNDAIVEIALDNGAVGAKLTGGGGGGCCIALARNKKHAEEILAEIKKAGFDGFCTSIS
jgi:mevalonate kinase